MYPKLMYESADCYGLVYYPRLLSIPFSGRLDENYEWLASLYGLSYKRIMPSNPFDSKAAWEEYINRIWSYLEQGVAIQTWRSWGESKEESGKIYTDAGIRPFWWEGIESSHRPQQHALVIVGLDKSKGIVYLNDPGCGWFGKGEYEQMTLDNFRAIVEDLPLMTRYCLRVFTRGNVPAKDQSLIEKMVQQRILKKLKGDAAVYDKTKENCLYGLKGLEEFKNDLLPGEFARILEERMQKAKINPSEVLSYLNMGLYQHSYIISIAAEYLESESKEQEWRWLSRLHILYEKLYILNARLISIFKDNYDLVGDLNKSEPTLLEMRNVLDELINLVRYYPKV